MTTYMTTPGANVRSYMEYKLREVRKNRPTTRQEFINWQSKVKLVREIKSRIEGLLEGAK